VESETRKALEELEYTKGFLISVLKKLDNERFVQNAPEAVIEAERKKKSDAEAKIKALGKRIDELENLKKRG
jgi:valyl-tRNA synthetase